MEEAFREFVKVHFRELKVKGATRMKMGRNTYDWLIQQENKDHLDHLSVEKLEAMAERYALKKVLFDDGNTYVVNPGRERDILVEFYRNKEMLEPRILRTQLSGDVPACETDLQEKYLISREALSLLAGDKKLDGPEGGETVDCLTSLEIEKALENGELRLVYDDGRVVVVGIDEDEEDAMIYPLVLQGPLAGTEVSIEELDLGRRTAVSGDYRDTVGEGSHDVEHLITKSED